MLLSTTSYLFFVTFGYDRGPEEAARAGFDALDMGYNEERYQQEFAPARYEALCKVLRAQVESCGLRFNQTHAPYWPTPFSGQGSPLNAAQMELMHRAIRCAGLLGADQAVVHPICCTDKGLQRQVNIDFYGALLPVARESGVRLAIENVWGKDSAGQIAPSVCSFGHELAAYVDAMADENVIACLDTGHAGLMGQPPEDAIRQLGPRLHALHVHDNDLTRDAHLMPYQGKLNWPRIMAALAEVGYDGDLTFEVANPSVDVYLAKPELMRPAMALLAATGRQLMGLFERAKAGKG